MDDNPLKKTDKHILTEMVVGVEYSTYILVKTTGLSWATVNACLLNMQNKGIVTKKTVKINKGNGYKHVWVKL